MASRGLQGPVRPFALDRLRTALLLSALLSFVAGASLMREQAPSAAAATTATLGGGSHLLVIAPLALMLGIIIFVLLIAD